MMIGFLLALTLGAPFSDGAVLQRGRPLPVWGQAQAGGVVTVEFAGQRKRTKVGGDGAWRVDLDALAASSEGRMLVVTESANGAKAASVSIRDILVGEVWFACGQSNMECPIWSDETRYRDANGGFLTTMTRLPLVRYAKTPRTWKWSPTPILARQATWRPFTPEGLRPLPSAKGAPQELRLSAVAFYYARELYLALGVPIGIVEASQGGTNIDAWTPRCGYENCDASILDTADYVVKDEGRWTAADSRGPVSEGRQQPTVLWNGKVAAFAPMAMRGMIWYQGCHNGYGTEPARYTAKMHALYDGWSKAFGNPSLSFYFAELAPYAHNWVALCAAQERFAAEEKNAALVVTSDVGNFDDIHPNNKEIVAKRLVLHALKRDYGFDIPEDGSPLFRSAEFKDGQAVLSFDHVKSWYVYAPNRSREAPFEVAGADGVWHPARIVNFRRRKDGNGKSCDTDFIDGSAIVVASEEVAAPVRVRYMARQRTAGTLYNEASLPLGVFETM